MAKDGMRLIDANALISNLRTFKGLGSMVAETLVRFTEKQPTVDAVEVVHGRWEDGFCTNCGEEAITEWDECGGEQCFSKYCPNCGAKMDGDGNG